MIQCKLCLAASAGIIATVVGLSLPAVGQPEKKAPVVVPGGAKPATPPPPSPEDMQKMMEQAATPDEHHKQMAILVGDWDAAVKMWMDPAQPPMESTGTATNRSIFDGRYIEGEFSGQMMGMPFHGKMTWAFNKLSGKYESTWIDNFGTGISWSEDGVYDPAKKTYTSHITMWDPGTQQKSVGRETVTVVDDNKHILEMFGPGMDGKEAKMMQITYTRKSAGAKPATR